MGNREGGGHRDGPRTSRVLVVGAEGGTASIVRVDGASGGVRFQVVSDESALVELLDDERVELFHDLVRSTFEDALSDFDRYPWRRLFPLYVAPAYGEQIWKLVRGTSGALRPEWQRLCQRPVCPKCAERSAVVEIIYGEPDAELNQRADAREIVLGGTAATDLQWLCQRCQVPFRNPPIAGRRDRQRARWQRWAWAEGPVDASRSHFELRYGSATDAGWDQWLPVARVGPARKRTFAVEWILDRGDAKHGEIVSKVAKDLDFYLVEKGEFDPWAYAKYHCGTAANAYSDVHWEFCEIPEPPRLRRQGKS